MAPHKPRKPAPVAYSTDEEDMILYDIEEEVESTKSIVRRLSEEYWQNEGTNTRKQTLGVGKMNLRHPGSSPPYFVPPKDR
ncbi:hypothetical protein TNCV_5029891 [Trichonephila clavipes]|nr:hypothetical protein TNCV_5029891 [Trichonephila clavipes]